MTRPARHSAISASPPRQAIDIPVHRLGLALPGDAPALRSVPVEAPIAIEISGIGYAVMMATPSDLADFATGFCLSEGLAATPAGILGIAEHEVEGGIVLRIALPSEGAKKAVARARTRVTESSCGLCGIDNIAEVLRPLPRLTHPIAVERVAIANALAELPAHQPLNHATGAVHGAAFCAPDGRILCVREDVGRHNALDKLIGALARAAIDPAGGFILLTARCSYELVEKAVRAGCSMLVTISAPTSLAAERAGAAGLSLVTLARADAATIVSGRARIG